MQGRRRGWVTERGGFLLGVSFLLGWLGWLVATLGPARERPDTRYAIDRVGVRLYNCYAIDRVGVQAEEPRRLRNVHPAGATSALILPIEDPGLLI
jgi:hypothetical protein